ncbi:MAG: DUF5060 domain-containing protein [Planctomycetes bacterium]|nr:DUF5060 domain-containing protein [Planctomycetota bacterium]
MQRYKFSLLVTICLVFATLTALPIKGADAVKISGEMKKWHKVTLTFTGPQTSETAKLNPFLDYRLDVMFRKGKKQYVVPGYYAADGNAGQSSATKGNKWRVHFVPDEVGQWSYSAAFHTGENIALGKKRGSATAFDGAKGSFNISVTDKKGRDHRGKGLLRYVGKRYLLFSETGEFFLKGGADSPENFLGYADFDNTYDSGELKRKGEAAGDKFIHRYEPHVKDWKPGDPTWKNGKGKGMIGALNYLASKGMNSVYFIPYNIDGGDGKDVWPWIEPDEKFRFDCSKLDQWEIVFSYMDKLGLMLHIILQEQENDQSLNGGELGPQRQLFYRELVARFGHHLALVWNLGEENTNTFAQRKNFCRYIKGLDPYDHPIVCHTFPGRYDEVYTPLLGYEYFDGPSLQTNDTHVQTLAWLDRSVSSGRQWFVCLDEIGPAHTGVKPDKDDYEHDEVRKKHLWGNLMAGGAGVEWYFGYKFAHNDLNCEDWRSREHMWDLTRYALEFFRKNLPFTQMTHHDELTTAKNDYCFAEPGRIYAIYLPSGGTTKLDMGNYTGIYSVQWYNPRTGGKLLNGSKKEITGPGSVAIGQPPKEADKDWTVLIKLKP